MKNIVFIIFTLVSQSLFAFQPVLHDSSARFWQETGFTFNVGYMGLQTHNLENYFSKYGFSAGIEDYVPAAASVSAGNRKWTVFLGVSNASSVQDGALPDKSLKLDFTSIEGGISYDPIHTRIFAMPFEMSYISTFYTLSLNDASAVPKSFNDAGKTAGSTLLTKDAEALSAGVKPTFNLVDHPGRSLSRVTLSLEYKYIFDIGSKNAPWYNVNNQALNDGPDSRLNGMYFGIGIGCWFSHF